MAKKKKKQPSKEGRMSWMENIKFGNMLHNERVNFILGIVIFILAIYLASAFASFLFTGQADQSIIENLRDGEMQNQHGEFTNSCGSYGAYLAYYFMKECFGLAAFVIPVFIMLMGLRLMYAYRVNLIKWFLILMLLMVWASVALAKLVSPLFPDAHFCLGGDHGLFICQFVEGYVGTPGLMAILGLIAIVYLVYLSVETVYFIRKVLNPFGFFSKIFGWLKSRKKEKTDLEERMDDEKKKDDQIPMKIDDPTDEEDVDDQNQDDTEKNDEGEEETEEDEENDENEDEDEDDDVLIDPASGDEDKKKGDDEEDFAIDEVEETEKADGEVAGVDPDELEPYDPKRDLENYRYPTLDLLKKYEDDGKPYIDMAEQTANKNRIVEVLRNFGIEISSIKATVGPTITLYEITPAQGVRISKIRNLEDDIALSLKALGIRIIAPIPGKGTIGIEVPNAKANTVSMESVLNSKKFQETTMELPCAMGKTITNEVFMFDLAKAPHLLVAGATGQGKSVGLNAILTSLLYKKHPAELKIVLVDPKMVEFSVYKTIDKHFLAALPEEAETPIITDTSKVIRTLQSLCVEMDARYELLMAAGERNIKDYNRKFIARRLNPEKGHKYMPYIVVVIDEFGDLIMTAGKEIELPIARIAQKARAVGIHMIIATQRPTTNIITGTIKANFPARIAFKVSQSIDSKTILDRMGAQQLIGRGDMLYLQGNDPIRVQCAFVDTPEVVAINEFIQNQQGYTEPFELPEPIIEGDAGGMGGESSDVDLTHLDPMFEDAARLIVQSGSGSTSLIQRKFSIGYNRAGRLMDLMEKAGVVGAAHGSKPREVLIQDEMSLEALLSTLRNR